MGGNSEDFSWDEYFDNHKDEYKPHILLIRQAIKALKWVGTTGGQKANDTYFKFSDGEIWGYSWRAWGDLMQSIVNQKEGYMEYYM